MVLRYWGQRDISAESFAGLVDRSASGIRTSTLVADLQRRGFTAAGLNAQEERVRQELSRGRPVIALIEDRPGTFHYVVVVAWHDRGIVFHDPARAPFRVMAEAEFDRRWNAADRWMAIVAPASAATREAARVEPAVAGSTCEQLIRAGVRAAQASDFDAAERSLAAALECGGPAALRELAGLRLLQKRWGDVTELASAALAEDPRDTYSWKVLATGRFVQDDRLGALEAWNHVDEPRVDLVRIEGLTRTRHRVVERLFSVAPGDVLTPGRFTRARRQLSELPAAFSTRLEYAPVPAGLAELRGAVAERPLLPRGRLSWAALGLGAAATREVRVTTGSVMGGGERVSAAWRFWPNRPRVSLGIRAPAPWGGVWGVDAAWEEQPFTSALDAARRTSAGLDLSDWATGSLRWNITAGADRWDETRSFGRFGGGVRLVMLDDRVDARIDGTAWVADRRFGTVRASLRGKSSSELRGFVWLAEGTVERASQATPVDLWFAGDTGHARATLLRAHPVLEDGRLRVDRLGRSLVHGSLEAQRWWRPVGPLRVAAAAFADIAGTSRLLTRGSRHDVDAGMGARIALTGVPGMFRVDIARGLRDGAGAASFIYEP